MNKKIQNSNNVCIIEPRGHGVGECGVEEPNGSDDDAFTDEQPKKEDILNEKGESIPLLDTQNSYGEYGNFKLVGHGKPTNGKCGHFFRFKGCLRVDLHNIVTLDGTNYQNKAFIRRVHHWCHKPSCPICYKHGWAVREAGNINARCKEASKKHGQVEHIICSVPTKDYGLSYAYLRQKAVRVLKKRGIIGGCLIFHGFRYNIKRQWYWSPHFHVLGYILGGYGQCRHCKRKGNCLKGCGGFDDRNYWEGYLKDGWIVKVLGERKSAFGTAWYQLNHSSYDKTKKRFHIATWFGVCSYRKLKVTPEKRKEVCPICQQELVYIKYVGKTCVIKRKDDPDYNRDSFEDFLDSSEVVRWIMAPKSTQT
ncbi:MAG: hypothetical protein NUK63_07875 [Candidatus Bathyarchaeum tardum]|nr:MAG: hypothetical protein NUK63_07875 [Candidatus Bathyarchaeum tardum]